MSEENNPTKFKEAWDHHDQNETKLQREAICKEFNDMKKREVWKIMKKYNIPKDRKLIGNKWVFKIKKDKTHRARLVGLGYNQVPGLDFSDNFSPVVSDTAIKLLIVIMIKKGWNFLVMDIEVAFLEGKITEKFV